MTFLPAAEIDPNSVRPGWVALLIVLALAGHATGWPCARGGSIAIIDAMRRYGVHSAGSPGSGLRSRPASANRTRTPRPPLAPHPPLFYTIAAAPLWLGERLGAPRAGLLAARLLSASLAAGGLVMVALLAVQLAPGRPRVAVAATWLAALLPGLPHVSAFVYNDGLGFLAAVMEAPFWAATLPQLPRLVHRALAEDRLRALHVELERIAAQNARRNRLLAGLLILMTLGLVLFALNLG